MKVKQFVWSVFIPIVIVMGASWTFWGRAASQAGKPEGEVEIAAALNSRIGYQGKLTESGKLVNGTRNLVFRFFNNSACSGSPLQSVTKNNVQVSDGLFHVFLDVNQGHFNGQGLWLRVSVDGVNLGCEEILAAPYALSLRPGARLAASSGATLFTADNQADGLGLLGTSQSGTGVGGEAFSLTGANRGVWGQSNSQDGAGVLGSNTSTSSMGASYGVLGATSSTTNSIPVAGFQPFYSFADFSSGFFPPGGFFGGRNGIVGLTKANVGYGVFGWDRSPTGGRAGNFISENGDGVIISTQVGKIGLSVSGGSKNAVVATDDGSRLLYTEESSEVWFTDYGFGVLQGGLAVVAIDPIFAQTVNLDEPYHVFVQAYGPASIYVSGRTPTRFEVRLLDGEADVEFSYRIVAKRLGFEAQRLEWAAWADNDPNLYPEKEGYPALILNQSGLQVPAEADDGR